MLVHPNFDPILVSIGPIAVRWYGLMYLVGFVCAWLLAKRRIAMGNTFFTQKSFEDFLFLAILGVVLGGRLGYILFYMPDYYLQNPLKIFAVTEGGMSFHGGLLGVLTAIAFTAWKHKRRFLEVGDFVAPLVPLGLGFGRIGNFINGELWGRPTDGPWGMIFPQAGDGIARHASQLYEATLEGFVLFLLLWWFTAKPRPVGQASAIFLVGYGVARFVSEFAREPDSFLGLLAGHLSMGQWLSMPMIIIGVLMWVWSRRQPISQH